MNQYEKFYQDLEKLAGVPLTKFTARMSYARREVDSYMKLTIEVIGTDVLSLAHWGEQNGDAMRDPEVCWRVRHENKTAEPITFRNDYMGIMREVYTYDEAGKAVGVRLGEKKDAAAFCRAWMRNLRAQGFMDPGALKEIRFVNESALSY